MYVKLVSVFCMDKGSLLTFHYIFQLMRVRYHIVKFLCFAIFGICLGIFEGFHGSQRAAPGPMCLPTMTQAGREHTTY